MEAYKSIPLGQKFTEAFSLRDRLTEMVVLGISAGGMGAALAWFLQWGFKEESVFAFFGALAGAAATVAGAIWATDRAERAAHQREQTLLMTESAALLEKTERSIALYSDEHPWPAAFRPSLSDLAASAHEVPAIFREALNQARTLDFRERVKLIKAERAIAAFDQFYQDVFGPEELQPRDDRDWPWALGNMKGALAELIAVLSRR
ncbi:hypothetical protein [Sphingobium lignivorans]|uniref:Uncharacterized protein n=1 Tax=Sphingobium lignivorans TaxID=2735886 RepID=A0ABR6NJC8_9SPHN|nr:hypothetical protein [Sphingobium lignivorans]MBB5987387.1 hypothetical protein [Sphingobium lignivorans]